MTTSNANNSNTQPTIDFPVWKTVTSQTCGKNVHTFDLIRIQASHFDELGSEEIAKQALKMGLEFAPHVVIRDLRRKFSEAGELSRDEEGLFIMNKYGETCFLSLLDGKWNDGREMSTYGFGPKAPIVLVKPRKPETAV